MKRLLEWKQRMLQSPLNRKVNQNLKGKPNVYYRNTENEYPQVIQVHPYSDGRVSANVLPQYNSYSSDDEGIFSFLTIYM
jgi:hypothetical protein